MGGDLDTVTVGGQSDRGGNGSISWNYGSSLAKVGTDRLATIYTTDVDVSTGDPDGGAKQKAMVRVGTVNGTTKAVTWSAPKRVSPAGKHVDRTSLAASGTNIYATYATQVNYTIDPAAPRQAFIRRPPMVGSPGKTPVSLSAKTGRVDYPIVAASGSNVYVAFTNSNTGAVVMRRSTDNGATFGAAQNLGTTTRQDGEEGSGCMADQLCQRNDGWCGWLPGDGTVALSVSENSVALHQGAPSLRRTLGATIGGWANCDARGSRVGRDVERERRCLLRRVQHRHRHVHDTAQADLCVLRVGLLGFVLGSVSLIGTGRLASPHRCASKTAATTPPTPPGSISSGWSRTTTAARGAPPRQCRMRGASERRQVAERLAIDPVLGQQHPFRALQRVERQLRQLPAVPRVLGSARAPSPARG